MGPKAEKKIVIVGKYSVGKTALVDRFTKNKFNEMTPYQPTIGAAFAAKQVTVGTKRVTLGIWDTAGSERFESMTPLYYRGAKAAIACYDITDKSSFEKAKFYIDELQKNNPDCRLHLCGTKCDLIYVDEKQRDVAFDEATDYGRNMKAVTVIETSSKTGQNVARRAHPTPEGMWSSSTNMSEYETLFVNIAEDLLGEITGNLEKSMHKLGLEEPSQNPRRIPCGCKS